MPKEITGKDEWHDRLTVPRDGEAIDAGDVNAPFQDLLSNDRFLRGEVARLANRLAALELGPSGFTLLAPTGLTLEPGRTYTLTDAISIGRIGGYAGAVDLQALDLPAGVTATFDPDPVAGGASTLTLTASANAVAGSYNVTIRGTADGMIRSALMPLSVTAQTLQSTFTVTASGSAAIDRTRGASTQVALGVNRTGGFADPIAFATPNLPAGVTAAFSTNPVTGGAAYQQGATVLTLTAAESLPAGRYSIPVRATSGSTVRSVSLELTVSAPAAQVGMGDYTLDVVYDAGDPRVINGATVYITRTGGFSGPVYFTVPEPTYGALGLDPTPRPVVLLNGQTGRVEVHGNTLRVEADGSSSGWRNSGITGDLQGLVGDMLAVQGQAEVEPGQPGVVRHVSVYRRYGTRAY